MRVKVGGMIDVRKTRQRIRTLKQIKTWQLIVLFVMTGFIAATFLRLNNVGMIERRNAVLGADKSGDTVDLERRLYDLQRYASEHMNADPGRVALEQTYQRDNEKAKQEQAAQLNSSNNDTYQKAEAVCAPLAQRNNWRWPDLRYTHCLSDELNKYPEGHVLSSVFQPLPTAPYYHTYLSPLWSPDFAGWSVALTAFIGCIILVRAISLALLMMLLRYRKSRL